MSVKRIGCLFVAVLLMSATVATAVEQTVGLFYNRPGSSNGYTLFSPIAYAKTYLISNDGLLVHDWESNYRIGNTAYILENGHLLRTADPGSDYFVVGGDAGMVQEFDWDGALLWEFLYSNEQHRLHHDIEPLPNGNVLMIAFELKTFEECIAAGRDPALLSAPGCTATSGMPRAGPTDCTSTRSRSARPSSQEPWCSCDSPHVRSVKKGGCGPEKDLKLI